MAQFPPTGKTSRHFQNQKSRHHRHLQKLRSAQTAQFPLPKLQQIVKNQQDPRHLHRIKLMRSLFAKSLSPSSANPEIDPIIAKLSEIDQNIKVFAPRWPINQINKIDLAILRLSIWELHYQLNTPPKVIIDEAVEMAKTFGNDTSPGFINGVLGAVLKQISHDPKSQTP